jgi:shikimate kinase
MKNNQMSLREKSIVFIGFMGSGKTTVGQLVAKKLYRSFIDIDQEIEKQFEMSTAEIFKTFGEKTFRDKEKEIITFFFKTKIKNYFCWWRRFFTRRDSGNVFI